MVLLPWEKGSELIISHVDVTGVLRYRERKRKGTRRSLRLHQEELYFLETLEHGMSLARDMLFGSEEQLFFALSDQLLLALENPSK